MVYILDPNSGTAMSVDHQYMAQAIAERYPGFRLCQIPVGDRDTHEEFPFAIKHVDTNGIVKRLRESEMNISYIFEWLYYNDSAIHGSKKLFDQMIAAQEKAEQVKLEASKEKLADKLDFVNWAGTRAPHTLKVSDKAAAAFKLR